MTSGSERASFPQPSRGRFRFCPVSPYIPPPDRAARRFIANALRTGAVARGPAPQRLSEAVSAWLDIPHALPLNRARSAIEMGLRAMGVGAGCDVVLPAYVCSAVLEPILNVEARPVYAEVDESLHVNPDTIERALTPQTRCVIVPHLFGNAAPIDGIEKLLGARGIALLDDAAQSFGAKCNGRPVGTFGTCGVIGCGAGKALDGPAGGLLVSRHEELMTRARAMPLDREGAPTVIRRLLAYWTWFRFRRLTLAFKGLSDTALGSFKEGGSRLCPMSNLEAGLALSQLASWRERTEARREEARRIVTALGSVGERCFTDLSQQGVALRIGLRLPEEGLSVEQATARLASVGIECGENYEPLYRLHSSARGPNLPQTETHRRRTILLPVASGLRSRRRWQVIREIWPEVPAQV